jgi:hypothetical protein
VSTGSLRSPWSPRVYTIVTILFFVVTVAAAARTEPNVTIEPMMAKGPADAPVTIIEFSDYQ